MKWWHLISASLWFVAIGMWVVLLCRVQPPDRIKPTWDKEYGWLCFSPMAPWYKMRDYTLVRDEDSKTVTCKAIDHSDDLRKDRQYRIAP